MSMIRIAILKVFIILLTTLSSQPAHATVPNEPEQFNCANVTQIPQNECEALVALYNSTDGQNWDDNIGWLVTTNICRWSGVTCSAGHITRLDLSNQYDGNNLSGNALSAIGDLTALIYLELSNYQLNSLPSEIGNLNNLKELYLSHNQLSSLPAEISNLNSLTKLDLSYNQLNSLPAEVDNLDNLTTLHLDNNQLNTLPAEIGSLDSLTTLHLDNNQLNSLPPEIGSLDSLTTLHLDNNQLNSLPPEIDSLDNLTTLHLNNNQLNSLPPEIDSLDNLTTLYLNNNQLNSLPPEIGNLDNLTTLYLNNNQLNSLLAEISNLKNLEELDFSSNQLNYLPTEIGSLKNLTTLRLDKNKLNNLPAEISNLKNLERLDFNSNQLSHLPIEIGDLNSLFTLDLAYNRLVIQDNNLRSFITKRDGDWHTTQTIAPTDVSATGLGQDSIKVTWSPIDFQGMEGYYEISVAKGDIFTVHGTTASKIDNRYVIDGLTSGTTYQIRIRTYTSAHVGRDNLPNQDWDDQPNELWSDYSEIISATTPELLMSVTDIYESDDNCLRSRSLLLDSPPQSRNFHQESDEDWLHFELQRGVSYRLSADPSGPDTQLEIELYLNCDGLPDQPSMPSTGNAEIIFIAPSTGRYYAKITNRDLNHFGEGTVYGVSLSIHDTGNDLAIIITGHDDGFTLQDNIIKAANNAYQAFRSGGIPPNRIRYLGLKEDSRGDADRDGISDIDTEATMTNTQEVITQWAVEHADDETRIFIYLMDHGLVDELMVKGREDIITAHQLDSWLDQLESETDASIAIIYEACLSGSFIIGVQSISKEGRIVITSTDDSTNAYPLLEGGAYFSDAFFSALRQGKNFHQAFRIGEDTSADAPFKQYPMLDDNGDGQYTEDDGKNANKWYLGPISPDEQPVLSSPQLDIIDGRGLIQVSASQLEGISKVWADIYRPDFVEPAAVTDGIMPELDLDRVEFSDNDGDGIYRGLYDNFIQVGTYRFVIYGADRQGNLIPPAVLEMEFDTPEYRLYLPVIQR